MKRMAIVGAGVAGLSAVYARLNGYEAEGFEAQPLPGGLCTAWRRFTFDGCVHFLSGSGPGGAFHPLWREVGVIDGCTFDDPVALRRFTDAGGTAFTLYADPGRLERHVAALAPGDAGAGRELADLVRAYGRARLPVDKPFELFGPLDVLRLVARSFPVRRQLGRCLGTTCGEFAARFRRDARRRGGGPLGGGSASDPGRAAGGALPLARPRAAVPAPGVRAADPGHVLAGEGPPGAGAGSVPVGAPARPAPSRPAQARLSS